MLCWLQALRFFRENYKLYGVRQWLLNSCQRVHILKQFHKNKMILQTDLEAELAFNADFIMFDPYLVYAQFYCSSLQLICLLYIASEFLRF